MPHNNICSSKIFLDNYYTMGKEGVETPEIISDLVMKNGYVNYLPLIFEWWDKLKRVKVKSIYLPSYRDRAYSVIGIIVLLGREDSSVKKGSDNICELNQNFLTKIIKKEKQTINFMKTFYDVTLNLPYTSLERVCKIRELDVVQKEEENTTAPEEEEWIYKKEEEIY